MRKIFNAVRSGSELGHSKKKIFTVPEGEYIGSWHHGFCWLYDKDGIVFHRLDVSPIMPKPMTVRVVIEGVKAKLFPY